MTSLGNKLVHKEIHGGDKMERTRVNKQRHKLLYQRQPNIPGTVEDHGNLETRVMESMGEQFLNWSVHQDHSEGLLKQPWGWIPLQSF